MRKFIFVLVAVILAMGCEKQISPESVDLVPHELRINPGVDGIYTRAIGTQWEELDTIFIVYNYRASYDQHNGKDLSNRSQAVYREGEWLIEPTIYYPVGDSVLDLRFYHNVSGNTFFNQDTVFTLDLGSYNNNETGKVVDPLYYVSLGNTNTTEPLNINLEHKLSQLSLNTNNPSIKVLAIMQHYDCYLSLIDGATCAFSNDTVELTNNQIVIPQNIRSLIINGNFYDRDILVESGKMTELNITFSGKSVDFNLSISDWKPGMVYDESIVL